MNFGEKMNNFSSFMGWAGSWRACWAWFVFTAHTLQLVLTNSHISVCSLPVPVLCISCLTIIAVPGHTLAEGFWLNLPIGQQVDGAKVFTSNLLDPHSSPSFILIQSKDYTRISHVPVNAVTTM